MHMQYSLYVCVYLDLRTTTSTFTLHNVPGLLLVHRFLSSTSEEVERLNLHVESFSDAVYEVLVLSYKNKRDT